MTSPFEEVKAVIEGRANGITNLYMVLALLSLQIDMLPAVN
jgi:hypothetical protein